MISLIYDDNSKAVESKELYDTIFNDPPAYSEFYFRWVYPGNQGMLAYVNGQPVGMLHLNPYRIAINGTEEKLHYIVAVSVKKELRRRGIMAAMLKRSMNDMAQKGEAFTYLMPADRAYYEPFDFVFIMDWQVKELFWDHDRLENEERDILSGIHMESCGQQSFTEVADFVQPFLKSYAVHTVMDESYFRRAAAEAHCQDGDLILIRECGELKGVFAYGCEGHTVFVRLGFFADEIRFQKILRMYFKNRDIEIEAGVLSGGRRVPKIMARILNLKAMVSHVKTNGANSCVLRVKDSLIQSNDGIFQFRFQDGSMDVHSCMMEPEGTIEISDLTKIMFGYDHLQLLERFPVLNRIQPLQTVYITEEV